MLPNAPGALVYGSLQRFVNANYSIGLHSWQNVRIHRNSYFAMAKPLAGHLGVDAVREHVCCVSVPEIVETDSGRAVPPSRLTHSCVMLVGFSGLPSAWATTK